MYIHLVDGALALPSNKKMAKKKSQNTEKRVVKEADAHCALLPVEFPEFDHYMPINHLLQLSMEEIENLPGLDDALNRFEKMFKDLNNLI